MPRRPLPPHGRSVPRPKENGLATCREVSRGRVEELSDRRSCPELDRRRDAGDPSASRQQSLGSSRVQGASSSSILLPKCPSVPRIVPWSQSPCGRRPPGHVTMPRRLGWRSRSTTGQQVRPARTWRPGELEPRSSHDACFRSITLVVLPPAAGSVGVADGLRCTVCLSSTPSLFDPPSRRRRPEQGPGAIAVRHSLCHQPASY